MYHNIVTITIASFLWQSYIYQEQKDLVSHVRPQVFVYAKSLTNSVIKQQDRMLWWYSSTPTTIKRIFMGGMIIGYDNLSRYTVLLMYCRALLCC